MKCGEIQPFFFLSITKLKSNISTIDEKICLTIININLTQKRQTLTHSQDSTFEIGSMTKRRAILDLTIAECHVFNESHLYFLYFRFLIRHRSSFLPHLCAMILFIAQFGISKSFEREKEQR